MKFTTALDFEFEVDLKARVLTYIKPTPTEPAFRFATVSRLFVGSPMVKFYDETDEVIMLTPPVLTVTDDPLDAVTGEEGNIVFRTNNSVYEVNIEQKLIRRLAGHNPSPSGEVDHEWYPYTRISEIEIGYGVHVDYAPNTEGRVFLGTSTVKKMTGTWVREPGDAPAN